MSSLDALRTQFQQYPPDVRGACTGGGMVAASKRADAAGLREQATGLREQADALQRERDALDAAVFGGGAP